MKDFSKFKLVVNIKVSRKDKSTTLDGFNGYGKVRTNQTVPYGYFTKFKGKSGIYCITCKINNQHYIGSSKDIYNRIIRHYSYLNHNKHPNHRLQIDYNKYGKDNFIINILEETNEDLFNKEKSYQDKYGISNLYNLMIKGSYHSDAQRLAWARQNKDSHKTKEYRNKMSKIKQNKIIQFDKNYHKIAIYENSDEVCAKFGMAKSTLLGCCNGCKKSAFGYIWKYLDNDGNVITNGIGKNRTIMIKREDIV